MESVELGKTVEATSNGDGTFTKQVNEGNHIDGKVEAKGDKVADSHVEQLKKEISRLSESKSGIGKSRS